MLHELVTPRPRLLILRALGLGDLLTSVPALRALARAFPRHCRLLAAPLYLAPLVRLCAAVDEVIDAAPLRPLAVKSGTIDVGVNLHGRGPQSHRILLACEPRRLVAFAHEAIERTEGMPQWRAGEHEIDRWCRLLNECGIKADRTDLELRVPYEDERARNAIVVHPGAAQESRRWPRERWIALVGKLAAEGHRIVLTGSAAEFRRCRFIAKSAGLPLDDVLAGTAQLDELAYIIAAARAVICGDTGVAHLATALRRPSVVLFGPTSPQYWGPPPDRSRHRVIWRGIPGDPHAPTVDPGLASITPEEVIAALHDLPELSRAV